ncbi:MAG: hypothetical protein V3V05_09735 [Pontiella sp.]
MNQGEPDIAERHIAKAIVEVGDATFEQAGITRLLSDTTQPSVESIKNMEIKAADKALLCVALGFRFPADCESFNSLSRTYNFYPTYPQLFIKKWSNPKIALTHLKPAA